MKKENKARKLIKHFGIVFTVAFVCILASFAIHVYRVNLYNNASRTIDSDSVTTEATVEIAPRGQTTDSWEKNDVFPGTILYGKIYEVVVTNNSLTNMTDWILRVDIQEECLLNNAWCGTVEIHQNTATGEKVQTLDLRNYQVEDITLDYYMVGQDLLIPLSSGDTILYYPYVGNDSGELPIRSTSDYSGQAIIGMIFYSKQESMDLSAYTLSYTLTKSYFSGIGGKVFMIILPVWLVIMLIFAIIAWIVVRFEERFTLQSRLVEESLELCANIADAKDFYSKGHSERVAKYARRIAMQMGMDRRDCDNVYRIAMLHDIGNFFIPERIFKKQTKLSGEEYELMKTHTRKGAELLMSFESVPYAAEGALYHHERYDGTGYPAGKKGEEIPLIGRILAVADAYDAMSHDRTYRKRLTGEQIRDEFINNKGKQFDPVIVGVFLQIMDDLEREEE